MNLYLDDDTASGLLVKLLRAAGHDVLIPADAGTAGKQDPDHFKAAIVRDRVLVTHNHGDFRPLHDLVIAASGHHPGAFAIRRDNDPKRDMDEFRIVRAIRNLESSGVPIPDEFHILNQYR